jgi:hypothetical protein
MPEKKELQKVFPYKSFTLEPQRGTLLQEGRNDHDKCNGEHHLLSWAYRARTYLNYFMLLK